MWLLIQHAVIRLLQTARHQCQEVRTLVRLLIYRVTTATSCKARNRSSVEVVRCGVKHQFVWKVSRVVKRLCIYSLTKMTKHSFKTCIYHSVCVFVYVGHLFTFTWQGTCIKYKGFCRRLWWSYSWKWTVVNSKRNNTWANSNPYLQWRLWKYGRRHCCMYRERLERFCIMCHKR